MENKWEYDYSGLYQNGYTPAPPTGSGPSGQMPGEGGMPDAPVGGGEPPRKKRGTGKRVLAGVLALVLVAAVSFGGGYAGYLVASKNGGQAVIDLLSGRGQHRGGPPRPRLPPAQGAGEAGDL